MYKMFIKKGICSLTLVAFVAMSMPMSYAQNIATGLKLPEPGIRVNVSAAFVPPILKGMNVDVKAPFKFDFILDTGNGELKDQALKDEADKLIRYFLSSLTIPDKDLWVNLSPYEKDRIVTDELGITEMGRDMLAQDYILKQVTASLIYPESDSGKGFWKEVYARAYELYGTTDIPVDTFNKVWIVPNKAVVYENGTKAFVTQASMKVMLETDYLAERSVLITSDEGSVSPAGKGDLAKQILRDVIVPILEKEVNEGQNFTQLRQIYYSLILAKWYKDTLKDSILNRKYSDQKKVRGVDLAASDDKQKIYARYLEAFKKGVFNYVKEEQDINSQELIPRKYFSGGMDFAENLKLEKTTDDAGVNTQGKAERIKGDFNADAPQKKYFSLDDPVAVVAVDPYPEITGAFKDPGKDIHALIKEVLAEVLRLPHRSRKGKYLFDLLGKSDERIAALKPAMAGDIISLMELSRADVTVMRDICKKNPAMISPLVHAMMVRWEDQAKPSVQEMRRAYLAAIFRYIIRTNDDIKAFLSPREQVLMTEKQSVREFLTEKLYLIGSKEEEIELLFDRLSPMVFRLAYQVPDGRDFKKHLRGYYHHDEFKFSKPLFWSEKVLREVVHNRIKHRLYQHGKLKKNDPRPLAVVLATQSDHNAVFVQGGGLVENMMQLGYRVLYYEVVGEAGILDALKDATNLKDPRIAEPASLIVFSAHGDGKNMDYGGMDLIANIHVHALKRFKEQGVGAYLQPGGDVLLDSCLGDGIASVAEWMRQELGWRVLATPEILVQARLTKSKEGQLNAVFRTSKKSVNPRGENEENDDAENFSAQVLTILPEDARRLDWNAWMKTKMGPASGEAFVSGNRQIAVAGPHFLEAKMNYIAVGRDGDMLYTTQAQPCFIVTVRDPDTGVSALGHLPLNPSDDVADYFLYQMRKMLRPDEDIDTARLQVHFIGGDESVERDKGRVIRAFMHSGVPVANFDIEPRTSEVRSAALDTATGQIYDIFVPYVFSAYYKEPQPDPKGFVTRMDDLYRMRADNRKLNVPERQGTVIDTRGLLRWSQDRFAALLDMQLSAIKGSGLQLLGLEELLRVINVNYDVLLRKLFEHMKRQEGISGVDENYFVAFKEALRNAVIWGNRARPGAWVTLHWGVKDKKFWIELIDEGPTFDLREQPSAPADIHKAHYGEKAGFIHLIGPYLSMDSINIIDGKGFFGYPVSEGKAIKIEFPIDRAETSIEEQRLLRSTAPAFTLPSHGGPLGLDQLASLMQLFVLLVGNRLDGNGLQGDDKHKEISFYEGIEKQYNDLYEEYHNRLVGLRMVERSFPDGSVAQQDAMRKEAAAYQDWLGRLSYKIPDFIAALEQSKGLFVDDQNTLLRLEDMQGMIIRFQEFYIPFFQVYLNAYLRPEVNIRQGWSVIDVSTLISGFIRQPRPGDPLTDIVLKTKSDYPLRRELQDHLPRLDMGTDGGYMVKMDPRLLMFIIERMEENARSEIREFLYDMSVALKNLTVDPVLRPVTEAQLRRALRTTYKLTKALDAQGQPVVQISITNPGEMPPGLLAVPDDLLKEDPRFDIPAAFLWKKERDEETSGGTSLPCIWRVMELLGGKVQYRNVVIDGIKSVEAVIELPAAKMVAADGKPVLQVYAGPVGEQQVLDSELDIADKAASVDQALADMVQSAVVASRAAFVKAIQRNSDLAKLWPGSINTENPLVLNGLCVLAQEDLARRLKYSAAGLPDVQIKMLDTEDFLPSGKELHYFVVVSRGGKDYLLDTTFIQFFMKESAYNAVDIIQQFAGDARQAWVRAADQLLQHGYVELTDDVADMYMAILAGGARPAGVSFTARDLLQYPGKQDMFNSDATLEEYFGPVDAVGQGDKELLARAKDAIAVSSFSKLQDLGGVDFNTTRLDLQKTGQRADLDWGMDASQLENVQINGLVPVITSITFVDDLPQLFSAGSR